MADRSARIGHIVDQNSYTIFDVTDQDHGGYFVGLLPLFVDESEIDIQTIGNGRYSANENMKRKKMVFKNKNDTNLLFLFFFPF